MKTFIISTIILSSIKLAVETYFSADKASNSSETNNFIFFLQILDYIINGIFIVEFVIKSVAKGLVWESGTYLTDGWNLADFMIMLFSIADMALQSQNLGFIKVYTSYSDYKSIQNSQTTTVHFA
jgi:hypothetical protein